MADARLEVANLGLGGMAGHGQIRSTTRRLPENDAHGAAIGRTNSASRKKT
jgi:hypothetical protein